MFVARYCLDPKGGSAVDSLLVCRCPPSGHVLPWEETTCPKEHMRTKTIQDSLPRRCEAATHDCAQAMTGDGARFFFSNHARTLSCATKCCRDKVDCLLAVESRSSCIEWCQLQERSEDKAGLMIHMHTRGILLHLACANDGLDRRVVLCRRDVDNDGSASFDMSF